jgi:hypothetical protein
VAWLTRVLVESVLVVGSILLALTMDNWAEDRENEELAQRSLINFEREVAQNLARLEDVTPFHAGLRSVLANLDESGLDGTSTTFRDVLEGFQPAILLSTAWETAVASGALSHMEFDIVSALSLTYGVQERLARLTDAGLSDLLMRGAPGGDFELVIYAANRYMRDLAESEASLQGVYVLVLGMLEEANADPEAAPDGAGGG